MINIRVERKRISYDFKTDPKKPDSFENNWKNNSLDRLVIRDENIEVFCCRCQSVANYCFGSYATPIPGEATIAPGNFTLKAFVPPRNFHGEIHGITGTRSLDGDWIDCTSMKTTKGGFQNGRFLIHDRFSFNTNRDTNYAWSAGCFITSSKDLELFNQMLRTHGVKPGDLIPGLIIEE